MLYLQAKNNYKMYIKHKTAADHLKSGCDKYEAAYCVII